MTTLDPASAPAAVRAWLARARPVVDAELARRLPVPDDDPGGLAEAMRYAATGPGKRLRPALALAACEAVGGGLEAALPAAAAIELLHAYTLVHDDLPAMDDDELRRGRPTVHVAFGEAIAILAGDGLQAAAFGALAELGPRAADAVRVLAARAGAAELLGGQALDLTMEKAGARPAGLAEVERLHRGKTGALFAAACELGGIAGGAGAEARAALARYGMCIGIAFQHADDRDDAEFADLAAAAAARMRELATEAEALAAGLGPRAAVLTEVAAWMRQRA
jgi:geranylgeranyl diphosphate synthase, type II